MRDPVGQFEHSHAALTRLALEVRGMVRARPPVGRSTAPIRKRLTARLEQLRDELLRHFANEEEGLFPFIRAHVPAKAGAVDRLSVAHDTICGSIVRLAQLVEHDRKALGPGRAALLALHERFEKAYAEHSQEEASLFDALGRTLDERQRAELAKILVGL
jgi:iron-sulfur cluster repair protein YtfE (RIC family)